MDVLEILSIDQTLIEMCLTKYAGQATEVIKEEGSSYDRIIISGGDGTLNEAITGLFSMENPPILAYIPSGSTNDFAKTLRLPRNIKSAARLAKSNSIVKVDVALLNEKPFIYAAAFGAFTEVTYLTPQTSKNRLGHQAYLIEAVKSLTNLKAIPAKITYEEGVIEESFLYGMISNTTSVGGINNITGKRIELDDGIFEGMFVIAPKNPFELNDIFIALLMNKESEFIVRFKTKEVIVETQDETEWVIDGEFAGSFSKTKIEVIQQKLPLAMPLAQKKSRQKVLK